MAWISLLVLYLCYLQQNEVAGQVVTLTPSFNPMFVKSGSKLSVECRVSEVGKDQDAEWQHSDYGDLKSLAFSIRKSVTMENNKAVISIIMTKDNVEDSLNGRYICLSGEAEKSFQLVVTPVMTLSANVSVGEDVTIRCDPNTNFKQMDLVWSKKGKPLNEIADLKDRVVLGDKNFSLTVQKTAQSDAGEYECTMTFFRGMPIEQSFKSMASLSTNPYFKSGDGDKSISLMANSSIDLSCDTLGYPTPDVTWLKDDEILQLDSRNVITNTDKGSRLKITKLTARDPGTYVCNVENDLGRKQRSFKVTIQGIVSGASCFSWGISQMILLVCTLVLTLHA